MQQTTTKKKKKKKRNEVFLLTNFESLSIDEVMVTEKEMMDKLVKIFRYHIGEANAISPHDLFIQMFDVNPNDLSIYRREFWWNILKKMFRLLRKTGSLYIVNKRVKLFVLQNSKEMKDFEKQINRTILGLEDLRRRGWDWVNKEKWRSV